MILTKEWMERTFDAHNEEYWSGRLRKPSFVISHVKRHLGTYNRLRHSITMSDIYDRDEHGYAEIMLHEMVHLYLHQFKVGDYNRKHHGTAFYAEAARLNNLGWNIRRCTATKGLRLTESKGETYRVMAYEAIDGTFFKMCINKAKEPYFRKRVRECTRFFKSCVIADSCDEATFASYPKCTARFRGWYTDRKDYEAIKAWKGAEMLK